MSVERKPEGASGELLFFLRDPSRRYTIDEVIAILGRAEDMGLPLEEGSYLEQLTIRQIDALVNDRGKCDA